MPLALALVAGVGCHSVGVRDGGAPPPQVEPSYAIATPVIVEVPGDRPLLVAHAPPQDRRAIVYLHGKCVGYQDLASWASTAESHGTIVALQADTDCPGGGTRWTLDVHAIERRVDDALRAVSAARDGALDAASVTVVGYSQGAARAEALAAAYPGRFRRVVLIGGPTPIGVNNLQQAEAVVTMAGERDRQDLMKDGARDLRTAGRPTLFLELPRAAHGEYGPEGARVLDEALTFVERPSTPEEGATLSSR